jgi:hypothetical protein
MRTWVIGVVLLYGIAVHAAPLVFDFSIASPQSTTTLLLDVKAQTSGTVIGDYDGTTNPNGTRTKPGLFGSFGDTENVAVPIAIDPRAAGPANSSAAGVFRLIVDPMAGTAEVSGLSANLLHSGSIVIPVNAAVSLQNFRTRNPSSTYFAANVNIPLGDATVTKLTATQTADAAVGTLTPAGANQYAVAISPTILLEAEVEFEGNPLTAPATPVLLPVAGTLTINGDTATFTATAAVHVTQTDMTPQDLPPFPFGLPTILPPGGTANVLLDLTVEQTDVEVTGTTALLANGVAVPEPAGLLWVGLFLIGRRRLNLKTAPLAYSR